MLNIDDNTREELVKIFKQIDKSALTIQCTAKLISHKLEDAETNGDNATTYFIILKKLMKEFRVVNMLLNGLYVTNLTMDCEDEIIKRQMELEDALNELERFGDYNA